MELIRGLHNLEPAHRGCAVTIGNFDGVHRGHQAVLDQLAGKARELGVPSLVMIFEPQPGEFFAPGRAPARLTRLREKLCALDVDAVDRVLCVRFDAGFAALSARAFVEDVLHRRLGARYVVVGDDFRFGHGREGRFEFLVQEGARLGFEVDRRNTFTVDGERVSSTGVREALGRGDLARARRLLGYHFNMRGRVAHGDKRGRSIGFPTANIHLHRLSTPVRGVFAVGVAGIAAAPWPGVANIGFRPTVEGGRKVPILEVHLLDFSGDVYGRHVRVDFLEHIRAEAQFGSLDELRAQIARDVARARDWHAAHPSSAPDGRPAG